MIEVPVAVDRGGRGLYVVLSGLAPVLGGGTQGGMVGTCVQAALEFGNPCAKGCKGSEKLGIK